MSTTFIQIFESKDDALRALGLISSTHTNYHHQLIDTSSEIQLLAKISSNQDFKKYFVSDETVLYLVFSTPKGLAADS